MSHPPRFAVATGSSSRSQRAAAGAPSALPGKEGVVATGGGAVGAAGLPLCLPEPRPAAPALAAQGRGRDWAWPPRRPVGTFSAEGAAEFSKPHGSRTQQAGVPARSCLGFPPTTGRELQSRAGRSRRRPRRAGGSAGARGSGALHVPIPEGPCPLCPVHRPGGLACPEHPGGCRRPWAPGSEGTRPDGPGGTPLPSVAGSAVTACPGPRAHALPVPWAPLRGPTRVSPACPQGLGQVPPWPRREPGVTGSTVTVTAEQQQSLQHHRPGDAINL